MNGQMDNSDQTLRKIHEEVSAMFLFATSCNQDIHEGNECAGKATIGWIVVNCVVGDPGNSLISIKWKLQYDTSGLAVP